MKIMKKTALGLAIVGLAVMLLQKVFVEGEYLIAAGWGLLLLWLAHPSGQRAYLERRARGIPPGQTGFNAFTKAVFGTMLTLTLIQLYQWAG